MYWETLGILNLLRLTWQDIKNNMMVDDRYNYFMMGASIMLLSIFKHTIGYIIGVIFTILILSQIISRKKLLGRADANTVLWSFVGWAYIGLQWLLFYATALVIVITATVSFHRLMYKVNRPMPMYHAFLIAFVVTIILKYI